MDGYLSEKCNRCERHRRCKFNRCELHYKKVDVSGMLIFGHFPLTNLNFCID